jgi:colanic acid/amylovoran biosynthesis glycosyltransferase
VTVDTFATPGIAGTARAATTTVGADRPGVLIYAPHLLPLSQHYVREHGLRLRRYRPFLAGRRRVQGAPIDGVPSFTLEGGFASRVREFHFLLAGQDAALAAFVRRNDIRLIHAHFGPGGAEIMRLAARLRVPLVVTFHGWDLKVGAEVQSRMSPYERLYRARLPRLLRQASEVICVSQNWADRLPMFGCPPEKIHTNYLGVDSKFFDGVRSQFDPSAIIFVGRLIRRKGVHTLLEALAILRDRKVGAHLTIVGEGPELANLQRSAVEQNLPVRFLGKKTPAEIRELLRKAALLCAPSTTAGGETSEALGLVFLEAQAMSVPVVGTRNGGIAETLEEGRTGFLVEQDSPSALASALTPLLNNEDLNRSFGQRARAFVCDRFDIDGCYRSLEDIYDRIEDRGC